MENELKKGILSVFSVFFFCFNLINCSLYYFCEDAANSLIGLSADQRATIAFLYIYRKSISFRCW